MHNDRHPDSYDRIFLEWLILGHLDEKIYNEKRQMLDYGYIFYNSAFVKVTGMTDTELYRAIDEKKNLCNSCEHKKDKKTKANKRIIIAIIIFAVLLLGVGIWLLVEQSLVVDGVVGVIIVGILSIPSIFLFKFIAIQKKLRLQREENLYAEEKLKLETELQRREKLKAQNMMSNKDDIEVETLKWCGSNPYVKHLIDVKHIIKELKNKEKEEGQN